MRPKCGLILINGMIPYSKYSGLGNDFLIVDNRSRFFDYDPLTIAELCDRKEGVGADGMLFLEHSTKGIAKMRIFNSDGSEAEMCGNGIRCFVKYLSSLGMPTDSCKIETMNDLLHCWDLGNLVKVEMPIPRLYNLSLHLEGVTLTHLDTGVPHAVLFVDRFDKNQLAALGRKLRNHPHFAPSGSNITFAKKIDASTLEFCTYERGVEGITLACGTGSVAAALAFAFKEGASPPLTVKTLQGDPLFISFKQDKNHFTSVTMAAGATCLFNGIANKKSAPV